jgi:hypothetical protein
MLGEVRGVMAARVDVKFMGNFARSQKFVESDRSGFEAEVILVSTIEINLQVR